MGCVWKLCKPVSSRVLYNIPWHCDEASKYPPTWRFAKRLTGYIQWQIIREKDMESRRIHPYTGFVMLSSSWEGSHRAHTSPSKKNAATWVWYFCQGSPWVLSAQGFTGSWSHRHPLPTTNGRSSLPEGNPGFSINYVFHTNGPGTVKHSSQKKLSINIDSCSPAKFPDASQRPDLQAGFLDTAVSDLLR